MAPRWTRGAKEAVGTAYSGASHVWYTVAAGILTEVFYPTIDTPQIRDLQYLVTDGETFFDDERRGTETTIECVDAAALGFQITNVAKNGLYTIHKTLIGHPYEDCVLLHTRFDAPDALPRLQLYVLCAPHLNIGGWHNNAEVIETNSGRVIVAFKGSTWMALGATAPVLRCSCGYVAENDGWTDLRDNFRMDWTYDAAVDGNIAVTAQIDLSHGTEFTVALAFGDTRHRAIATLLQSVVTPFAENLRRFQNGWKRTARRYGLSSRLTDGRPAQLFERSVNLLLAHEDKSYPGAIIAAMGIPWGDSKGDEELGAYHLVWNRDAVHAATGLLAAGDLVTPLRTLVYLAVSQRGDGGFYQNFWLDGRPYWTGIQLDGVSFPVVLAWRLKQANALGHFDPSRMVAKACGFLVREGPATAQERWEEAAGYSPSTLAIQITALVCAAEILDGAGDADSAQFMREYADFLEARVERWTVTSQGTLVPGIHRHYIRINPNTEGREDPDEAVVALANQRPGEPYAFRAKEIVDAGFLELVRYGIRAPDDPTVEDSVRVVDAVLKVETPGGPCWRRYNRDGYGQRDDGTAYDGWGVGRLWPLLTGERGHYELAAGRSATPYLAAMEQFAVGIGLLPEQIWDGEPMPGKLLSVGGPTGAVIPLAWAHAEYVKLLRSVADGRVFDCVEPVRARYVTHRKAVSRPIDVWSFRRPIAAIARDHRLRVIGGSPFCLHWTDDEWAHSHDTDARSTALAVWYVDLGVPAASCLPLRFTFYWPTEDRWEGRDYVVDVIVSASPTT